MISLLAWMDTVQYISWELMWPIGFLGCHRGTELMRNGKFHFRGYRIGNLDEEP